MAQTTNGKADLQEPATMKQQKEENNYFKIRIEEENMAEKRIAD